MHCYVHPNGYKDINQQRSVLILKYAIKIDILRVQIRSVKFFADISGFRSECNYAHTHMNKK